MPTSDGIGVALHQSVLLGFLRLSPVALPGARDEGLKQQGEGGRSKPVFTRHSFVCVYLDD